ncbi:MAG: ABC transporter permease [Candidatus Aminicenantales bacterium]
MSIAPFLSVYRFSAKLVRRSKRTKVFVAVSCLPVLLAVILQINRLASSGPGLDGLSVFSNVVMGFSLQFLVLLLSLFFGTSIVADEVDNKTLTYPATRPVSKAAFILGKYAASVSLLLILLLASTVVSFLILMADRLSYGAAWAFLGKSLAALAFGTICYTALFSMAGTFLKKSILFGLFFCFGWENVVQYFPGTTQKFTIMHYLKSLLPGISAGAGGADGSANAGLLKFLLFRQEPTPVVTAIVTLIVLTAVFAGLACWIYARKEYLFDE